MTVFVRPEVAFCSQQGSKSKYLPTLLKSYMHAFLMVQLFFQMLFSFIFLGKAMVWNTPLVGWHDQIYIHVLEIGIWAVA